MCKPFITGTAAYGPFKHQKSDIDVIMMYYHVANLRDRFIQGGFEIMDTEALNTNPNVNYQGFIVDIYGRKFQFIAMTTREDYNSWKYATEQMKSIEPIILRKRRITRFKNYRETWFCLDVDSQLYFLEKYKIE